MMMRIMAVWVLVVALAAAQQTRTVNLTGTTFVDTVSGTNITNIQLGDSVKWVRLNGTHTVTSGFAGPGSGSLFNVTMNATTTMFTFTPTAPGNYPYFCSFHQTFGMIGTIVVAPPFLYPGSGEDLVQGSAINAPGSGNVPVSYGGGNDVKYAVGGNVLTLVVRSTNGTFNFTPVIVAAQLFVSGQPAPPGALPGLHINTSGGVILVNGLDVGTFGAQQWIVPGGSTYGFLLPPGLTGFSIMVQSLAVTSSAANGFFAISEGHEVQMF